MAGELLSVSSHWHCHALGIPKPLVPLLGISTAIEMTGEVHASLTGTAIFWVYQTRR
jgi:hypothetical protein